MWSVSVFVLKAEKTFDLSCLPEDNENVFETREIVHLREKSFAKFFIGSKGAWWKSSYALQKENSG